MAIVAANTQTHSSARQLGYNMIMLYPGHLATMFACKTLLRLKDRNSAHSEVIVNLDVGVLVVLSTSSEGIFPSFGHVVS